MKSADKIYAQALLDLSHDGKAQENVIKADLAVISDAVKNSSDLYSVLISPAVSFDKKKMIISDVFKGNITDELLNFVCLLTEKNKFNSFEDVVSAFLELSDDANGIKHVKVYSAFELDDKYKQDITDKLNVKLSKNTIPEWIVDKDIIGGLIIRYDDNVIDMSVKNKLDKIMKGNV